MSAGFTTVIAVAACGTVVAVTEAAAIPLLRRAAIVDVPGHRSSHAVPTPRGGGVPVAAGLLVAAGLIGGATAAIFAFAVAAFGLLGSVEDLRGLDRGPAADHAGSRRGPDRRVARQRPGRAHRPCSWRWPRCARYGSPGS